ncbi:NACHT domain-containing protein [Plantactinospora soyae]|uniref:NACHT domain-containing protein n=1 Tax=Plantactinospora soyae TaxID=1544732 RepID=A0A927QXT5_9ACTN|nr:hypothetical protein [Plantactinospora soyae]MBE1488430.1 hypothetical protein [Plantactinospora soyae]
MPREKNWRVWPLIGLVIVVALAASALASVAVSRDSSPIGDDVQTVTSVLAVTGGLVLWLWTRLRPEVLTSADVMARASDALAKAVQGQWIRAANERRLQHPAPIAIRWRWAQRGVTGPASEALGTAGYARFDVLPGMTAATPDTVMQGDIPDIFRLYGGLDSGRVLLLGDPGTGKSAAAILTVLNALKQRQHLDEPQRARVPVPVLLTAQGWDPRRQRLHEWLVIRLNAEYAFLRSGMYGQNAATRLVESGLVALVLDGFDEIADELRPVALRALDEQATFRMMVLTRTGELVEAVAGGHLHGAAALELLPVPATEAADYLTRSQVHPTPPAWQRLVEHLQGTPESAVSSALDNPLMLTLVRDTFPTPAEVDDLLTPGRFASRAEVEVHLLGRVLAAAYRSRPGQRPNSYSLDQASRWLGYLAAEMSRRNTRDLAWWQIRRWAPASLRSIPDVVASSIGYGVTVSVLLVIAFDAGSRVAAGIGAGLVNGITTGMLLEWQDRRRDAGHSRLRLLRGCPPNFVDSLTVGLASGLLSGLAGGVAVGFALGLGRGPVTLLVVGVGAALAFGLACGSTEAILVGRRNSSPRYLQNPRLGGIVSRKNLLVAIGFGIVFGLVSLLAVGLTSGPLAGLISGLAVGAFAGLALGLLNGLVQPSAQTLSPMDPVTSWRRDRQSGIVEGVIYGLSTLLMFGLAGGLVDGIATGLGVGLVAGLGIGLPFAFSVSQSWLATFGFVMLRCAGLFPWQGMRFLEDARARGVLRTVGSVYQFRHARLQDELSLSYQRDVTRR